jgi:peptidoglycan/xylan/chitin deacetylase (PgdA/CDA1 family)
LTFPYPIAQGAIQQNSLLCSYSTNENYKHRVEKLNHDKPDQTITPLPPSSIWRSLSIIHVRSPIHLCYHSVECHKNETSFVQRQRTYNSFFLHTMSLAHTFVVLIATLGSLAAWWGVWWVFGVGLAAIYIAFCPPRFLLDLLTFFAWRNNLIFRYKPYYRSDDKPISITIDDAPSANTPAILAVLRNCNVKATFFIIRENAERYPSHLRDIIIQGHLVANHDVKDHVSAWKGEEVSIKAHSAFLEETMRTYGPDVVAPKHHEIDHDHDPLHPKVRFFRPGSGLVNDKLLKMCRTAGMTCVLGDAYGHDCQMPWVAFQVWFLRWRVTSGSIIILHDGDQAGRALRTAAILGQLIPRLKANGFRPVRLDYCFPQRVPE